MTPHAGSSLTGRTEGCAVWQTATTVTCDMWLPRQPRLWRALCGLTRKAVTCNCQAARRLPTHAANPHPVVNPHVPTRRQVEHGGAGAAGQAAAHHAPAARGRLAGGPSRAQAQGARGGLLATRQEPHRQVVSSKSPDVLLSALLCPHTVQHAAVATITLTPLPLLPCIDTDNKRSPLALPHIQYLPCRTGTQTCSTPRVNPASTPCDW